MYIYGEFWQVQILETKSESEEQNVEFPELASKFLEYILQTE